MEQLKSLAKDKKGKPDVSGQQKGHGLDYGKDTTGKAEDKGTGKKRKRYKW